MTTRCSNSTLSKAIHFQRDVAKKNRFERSLKRFWFINLVEVKKRNDYPFVNPFSER